MPISSHVSVKASTLMSRETTSTTERMLSLTKRVLRQCNVMECRRRLLGRS